MLYVERILFRLKTHYFCTFGMNFVTWTNIQIKCISIFQNQNQLQKQAQNTLTMFGETKVKKDRWKNIVVFFGCVDAACLIRWYCIGLVVFCGWLTLNFVRAIVSGESCTTKSFDSFLPEQSPVKKFARGRGTRFCVTFRLQDNICPSKSWCGTHLYFFA